MGGFSVFIEQRVCQLNVMLRLQKSWLFSRKRTYLKRFEDRMVSSSFCLVCVELESLYLGVVNRKSILGYLFLNSKLQFLGSFSAKFVYLILELPNAS